MNDYKELVKYLREEADVAIEAWNRRVHNAAD